MGGVVVYDVDIVDVSSVVSATECTFGELVENIHVDVAEQLRGEVADWQATAGICVEQGFFFRQRVPIFL